MDLRSPEKALRTPLLGMLVTVLLLVLAVSCRGNIGLEEPMPPRPTATATPTPWPTPTPKPFRLDCDEITNSLFFVSISEKDWFIDNCLVGPPVTIVYDSLPGIGARVMEIHTVDDSICSTGLVSFTAFHRPNLERFYYTFRYFCAYVGIPTLAFPPMPLTCDEDEKMEAMEVTLPYLNGLERKEVEVFCNPVPDPVAEGTPAAESIPSLGEPTPDGWRTGRTCGAREEGRAARAGWRPLRRSKANHPGRRPRRSGSR